MRKQDKQNSIELKKRLSLGFGIVTMITFLAVLISFFTFYGLYLTNAISTKLFSSFTIILLILVFTAIIASSIICKIINKSIVKPLNILINIAKQMAVVSFKKIQQHQKKVPPLLRNFISNPKC